MQIVCVNAATVRDALQSEAWCIMSAQFDQAVTRGTEATWSWCAESATKKFTIN